MNCLLYSLEFIFINYIIAYIYIYIYIFIIAFIQMFSFLAAESLEGKYNANLSNMSNLQFRAFSLCQLSKHLNKIFAKIRYILVNYIFEFSDLSLCITPWYLYFTLVSFLHCLCCLHFFSALLFTISFKCYHFC